MDLINGIMNSLSLSNLFYCFIGCVLGTLVGVLPGLGPASSLAILLPLTLYLNPTGSFIAGTIGAFAISIIGPETAKLALKFGPPEYTGLMFFSLIALSSLSGK